jgi:hypothetical protein
MKTSRGFGIRIRWVLPWALLMSAGGVIRAEKAASPETAMQRLGQGDAVGARRDYEALLEELMAALCPEKHATAVALAAIPEKIRGFGHVKLRHLTAAKAEEAALLAQLRAPTPAVPIAAE